jgi:hypothetical protein
MGREIKFHQNVFRNSLRNLKLRMLLVERGHIPYAMFS